MIGDYNHNTIRINGKIKNKNVSVLIDTGSSSSFIDSKLVSELKLKKTPTRPVVITIANGSTMMSKSMCHNVSWMI